jgi:hypothetical protein
MKINQIVVTENEQLDELSWKDIQKGAGKIAKGAQKFQKNVAQTGDAVAGAANAVGGAGAELAKQAIARPVGATYNAVKGGLGKAADTVANTYGDVKKGVQAVGNAAQTVGTDVGNAGAAIGKGAKAVGTAAGKTLGGAAQAVGAIPGAVAGVPGAIGKGYDSAKSTVSGNPVPDKAQAGAQGAAGSQAQGGQQTDAQGNFIQRGLGKVAGAVGAVAGVPAGMGRAFDAGKQRGADAVAAAGGEKQTGGQQAAQPAQGAASDEGDEPANVKAIQQQIATKQKEIDALKSQLAMAQDVNKAGSKASNNPVTNAANTVEKTANWATDAVKAGVGMGAAGQSLVPNADNSTQTIKDKSGQDHQYKKVGQQWVNMADNKPVDPATAAMLDKQKGATAQAQPGQDKAQPANATAKQPAAAAQPQGKDVQGRMANQLGAATGGVPAQDNQAPAAPAQPAQQPAAAAPNFAPKPGGYGKATYNVPTGGVPQMPAVQPTTGAKAVPQQPAQPKVVSGGPTPAEREKLDKRIQAAQAQPVAESDFSAILARKVNVRVI